MLSQKLLDDINQLDLTDAMQLNNLLVSNIKTMQKTYSLIAKSKFSCNDYVCFLFEGTKYTGIILKMLRAHARIVLVDTTKTADCVLSITDSIIKVPYTVLQKEKRS